MVLTQNQTLFILAFIVVLSVLTVVVYYLIRYAYKRHLSNEEYLEHYKNKLEKNFDEGVEKYEIFYRNDFVRALTERVLWVSGKNSFQNLPELADYYEALKKTLPLILIDVWKQHEEILMVTGEKYGITQEKPKDFDFLLKHCNIMFFQESTLEERNKCIKLFEEFYPKTVQIMMVMTAHIPITKQNRTLLSLIFSAMKKSKSKILKRINKIKTDQYQCLEYELYMIHRAFMRAFGWYPGYYTNGRLNSPPEH